MKNTLSTIPDTQGITRIKMLATIRVNVEKAVKICQTAQTLSRITDQKVLKHGSVIDVTLAKGGSSVASPTGPWVMSDGWEFRLGRPLFEIISQPPGQDKPKRVRKPRPRKKSLTAKIRFWKKMDPMGRRLTVAVLAGWEQGPEQDISLGFARLPAMSSWHLKAAGVGMGWQDIPPAFGKSLDAARELENLIVKLGLEDKYIDNLTNVLARRDKMKGRVFRHIDFALADAMDRAEAFYLTMEVA